MNGHLSPEELQELAEEIPCGTLGSPYGVANLVKLILNSDNYLTGQIIDDISPDISMHDFRTIKGPHITNLIFDVLVPFGFNMKDDEIVGRIKDALRNKHENWRAVIQVDKKMF